MPKWLPKFAPGPLAPEGECWVLWACSFLYTHTFIKAPSHHTLSLLILCRRHLSLIWLRNNFLFMCWMECCAGNKQFRASFRIPFWRIFFCVFDAFPLPFSQTFFSCFFMLFTSLFSMLFRWNSHAIHITFLDAFRVRSSNSKPAENHLFPRSSFLSDMHSTQ